MQHHPGSWYLPWAVPLQKMVAVPIHPAGHLHLQPPTLHMQPMLAGLPTPLATLRTFVAAQPSPMRQPPRKILAGYAEIIVTTPDGKIKGLTNITRAGTAFNEFLGIRYGQPPVGVLRFKASKAVEKWEDIYDATYEKGMCYQVPVDSSLETEDCLMLNVFSPVSADKNTSGLPVMVYIHGGGFVQSSGLLAAGNGPNFFMDYSVVLVVINYRLGPFGFLSTGDTILPGNLGLKDQILALQWIKRNIGSFGGDPEKVTIFGNSAGGASVSYLLLSPLSKDLFRAAISESGSSLTPWSYQRDHVDIAYKTAGLLNPEFNITENRNSTKLLEFLLKIPARSIKIASQNLSLAMEDSAHIQMSKGFFYTPVIEPEHPDAFLTSRMFTRWENGDFIKVPCLFGFNSQESLFMLESVPLSDYDKNHSLLVPFDMHIQDDNQTKKIANLIKQYYVGDGRFEDNRMAGINYHSNQDFDKTVIKQAQLQSKYAPVYFYEFTYRGLMSNIPSYLKNTEGVAHCDQQNYMFSRNYNNNITDNTDLSQFPEEDRNVHYRLMTLWTNFAKYMHPTPAPFKEIILQNITWPTVKPDQFQYMEIGKDLKIKSGIPKPKPYQFWSDLYDTYAVKPYDTF